MHELRNTAVSNIRRDYSFLPGSKNVRKIDRNVERFLFLIMHSVGAGDAKCGLRTLRESKRKSPNALAGRFVHSSNLFNDLLVLKLLPCMK